MTQFHQNIRNFTIAPATDSEREAWLRAVDAKLERFPSAVAREEARRAAELEAQLARNAEQEARRAAELEAQLRDAEREARRAAKLEARTVRNVGEPRSWTPGASTWAAENSGAWTRETATAASSVPTGGTEDAFLDWFNKPARTAE